MRAPESFFAILRNLVEKFLFLKKPTFITTKTQRRKDLIFVKKNYCVKLNSLINAE